MAADPRRQRALLAGLLVVLLLVVWWQFGTPGGAPAPASAPKAQRQPARRAATPADTIAEGVALDRLAREPVAPVDTGRDPFAYGARASASAGSPAIGVPTGQAPPSVASVPTAPVQAGPPAPPPIDVRFIGVIEREDVGTLAVLSDGRNVYYGREGEIVDGRWRIVSIGEESLQIEYADGRGRQTVRLTG
jgi:hypothetical protein